MNTPSIHLTLDEFETLPIYATPTVSRCGIGVYWRTLHSWRIGDRIGQRWWIGEFVHHRDGSYIWWISPVIRVPARSLRDDDPELLEYTELTVRRLLNA